MNHPVLHDFLHGYIFNKQIMAHSSVELPSIPTSIFLKLAPFEFLMEKTAGKTAARCLQRRF